MLIKVVVLSSNLGLWHDDRAMKEIQSWISSKCALPQNDGPIAFMLYNKLDICASKNEVHFVPAGDPWIDYIPKSLYVFSLLLIIL